jgi:hypothetical protein
VVLRMEPIVLHTLGKRRSAELHPPPGILMNCVLSCALLPPGCAHRHSLSSTAPHHGVLSVFCLFHVGCLPGPSPFSPPDKPLFSVSTATPLNSSPQPSLFCFLAKESVPRNSSLSKQFFNCSCLAPSPRELTADLGNWGGLLATSFLSLSVNYPLTKFVTISFFTLGDCFPKNILSSYISLG